MSAEQMRKEDARREVRGWLAGRPVLRFCAETIQRRLKVDGNDFTLAEVAEALAYLVSAKHVDLEADEDGATPYYQITAEGTKAHERRFT